MHESEPVHSPFLRPDSPDFVDIYTDAFVRIVGAGGVTAFSVGAAARWAGVTPQAVLKQAGGRGRFLELVTIRLADRWVAWSSRWDADLPAALPESEEERAGVRAWGAVSELARSEHAAGRPVPAEVIADAAARDGVAMECALEAVWRRPTDPELDAFRCLVAGVRIAMAEPYAPLPAARGRAVLLGWLSTTNPAPCTQQ